MNRKPAMLWRAARAAAATLLLAALGTPFAFGQQTQADAAKPDPLAFARGARLWAQQCARCHEMRDPKELRDDQWKPVVTHMQIRAGLSGAQARDILLFLQGSN